MQINYFIYSVVYKRNNNYNQQFCYDQPQNVKLKNPEQNFMDKKQNAAINNATISARPPRFPPVNKLNIPYTIKPIDKIKSGVNLKLIFFIRII